MDGWPCIETNLALPCVGDKGFLQGYGECQAMLVNSPLPPMCDTGIQWIFQTWCMSMFKQQCQQQQNQITDIKYIN